MLAQRFICTKIRHDFLFSPERTKIPFLSYQNVILNEIAALIGELKVTLIRDQRCRTTIRPTRRDLILAKRLPRAHMCLVVRAKEALLAKNYCGWAVKRQVKNFQIIQKKSEYLIKYKSCNQVIKYYFF